MFYGLSVITALGMHCLDVLYGLTHRLKSFSTGRTFAWDWHTYSLLLFGVVMVWAGAHGRIACRRSTFPTSPPRRLADDLILRGAREARVGSRFRCLSLRW